MIDGKVLSLQTLAIRAAELRAEGRQVVLCHGTFDLLHAGHLRHLARAAREGDVLLVTVTADGFVNKGPGRPVFPQALRAESLAALAFVDYVAINDAPTAVNVLEQVKPSVYVKGGEYRRADDDLTGNIALEQRAVERHGGRIFFTDEITFSSTSLLNEHFGVFPAEVRNFLQGFGHRYPPDTVIGAIKRLSSMRVLIVGDTIVDEYHYAETLGQTGKGNVLAVRYRSDEQFAGGAVAVANHVAGFVDEVVLLSALGAPESHEAFLRSRLAPNIEPVFLFRDDGGTLVKRRFVDGDMEKLFEVYYGADTPLPNALEDEAVTWLETHLEDFDAVIVTDFGNGFIGDRMTRSLAEGSRFLAVNTQINSGNRGYHAITRYPRADFVSLNEPEVRMAAHNRYAPLREVVDQVGSRLCARNIAVTLGTRGVYLFDPEDNMEAEVPALSTSVVDRIGAGDAFLSLAGLLAAAGEPLEVAGFAGSVAAALDVQIVCNREAVSPVSLFKYITTLLK